jgi:nickel/cobalt exporter
MKPADLSRTAQQAALAALLVICALAFDLHSANAQLVAFGSPHGTVVGGIAGWALTQQALFYRSLAGMIRSAKTDGFALWSLMGISFVYGVFHAAGPGHGKAVISSYLFANEETWRRGITLSFAAAAMQSLTAVAIVGIAAALLGATAKLMGDTVRVIEIVSYGLIVLLGARLLWVKGRGFIAALHALKAEYEYTKIETYDHDQCNHAHGLRHSGAHCHKHATYHGDDADILPWGHAHGPEPEALAGPGGWRRGLSAIVAVGTRPCSGAIIVLVFALAQGLFWAGIISTFVMGFGTAITVATIATLAVGAKALAKRVLSRPTGYGDVLYAPSSWLRRDWSLRSALCYSPATWLVSGWLAFKMHHCSTYCLKTEPIGATSNIASLLAKRRGSDVRPS